MKHDDIRLLNKLIVTTKDSLVAVDAHIASKSGRYIVTCSRRSASLVRTAEKICWKTRTLYGDKNIELCAVDEKEGVPDRVDFVAVPLDGRYQKKFEVVRDGATEEIEVYLFEAESKWIVVCEGYIAKVVHRVGKLLDSAQGMLFRVVSCPRYSGKYAKFVCVPQPHTAPQPVVYLSLESDLGIQLELKEYDLRLSDTLSYRQFIDGEIDVNTQSSTKHIVLSGRGDQASVFEGREDKIVHVAIGATASYKCILQKYIKEDCCGKTSWSLTLEVVV
jgi:hypothetical protein